MSLPGLTRQSRHSGTARISAFTRVFDALCAGPGIQMHALSSFWIPGSLAPGMTGKQFTLSNSPPSSKASAFALTRYGGLKTRRSSLASGGGYGGQANAPPPCFFTRRVRRRLSGRSASPGKEPRARGTPGVQKDPRASTPRDIEACRSPCASPCALVRAIGKACRKSAKPKASRARCLIGLLRSPPRWSLLLVSLGSFHRGKAPSGTRRRPL